MQLNLPDHLPPHFEVEGEYTEESGFVVNWSFSRDGGVYGASHYSRLGYEPILERAFKAMSEKWLAVTDTHMSSNV